MAIGNHFNLASTKLGVLGLSSSGTFPLGCTSLTLSLICKVMEHIHYEDLIECASILSLTHRPLAPFLSRLCSIESFLRNQHHEFYFSYQFIKVFIKHHITL